MNFQKNFVIAGILTNVRAEIPTKKHLKSLVIIKSYFLGRKIMGGKV